MKQYNSCVPTEYPFSSTSFFSMRFVSVYVVHLYPSIYTNAVWKKSRFDLSDRFYFPMINNLSTAIHAFTRRIWRSFCVDETLLRRYVNLSTNFKRPPFRVEMAPDLNTCTPFCLHSRGGQWFLLPAPGYATEIPLV